MLFYHNIEFVFQDPFNRIRYEIIGDDSAAQYFSVDATSGRVTVSSNLATDATRNYKVM